MSNLLPVYISTYLQIYMFAEWYKPGCSLEYPVGGTGALVEALVLRFSF